MKKVILTLSIIALLFLATPTLAVGPKEWQKAVNDIIELQEKCGGNEVKIQNLEVRVANLEVENTNLKNKVGILERMFNELRGLLVQVVQMLIGLINR
jgi:hypothetical protein